MGTERRCGMLKQDVEIGRVYVVRLGGVFRHVKLVKEHGRGWDAVNLGTGRTVYVKSAAKLRREVVEGEPV